MNLEMFSKNLKRYSFHIIVFMLLLFSFTLGKHNHSYKFLLKTEENHLSMLADLAGLKMILAEVSSLKLSFISGKTQEVEKTLDKAERVVLLSSIAILFQRILLDISHLHIFKTILFFLLLLSITFYKSAFLRNILICFIFLSPGLNIYTILSHQLANTLNHDFGNTLAEKLRSEREKIDREKAKLLHLHQLREKKIDKLPGIERFFEKFTSNVIYDARKAFNDIDGDLKYLRILLKGGGASFLVQGVTFATHVLLFMFIIPLLYFYIFYQTALKKVITPVRETAINNGQLSDQLTRLEHLPHFSNHTLIKNGMVKAASAEATKETSTSHHKNSESDSKKEHGSSNKTETKEPIIPPSLKYKDTETSSAKSSHLEQENTLSKAEKGENKNHASTNEITPDQKHETTETKLIKQNQTQNGRDLFKQSLKNKTPHAKQHTHNRAEPTNKQETTSNQKNQANRALITRSDRHQGKII